MSPAEIGAAGPEFEWVVERGKIQEFAAGVLSSFLTAWMGAGTVRRYRVRFTGQVWPGETLVCTGHVTGVEPAGDGVNATCELAVHNEAGERKIAAEAVCHLPD